MSIKNRMVSLFSYGWKVVKKMILNGNILYANSEPPLVILEEHYDDLKINTRNLQGYSNVIRYKLKMYGFTSPLQINCVKINRRCND